MDDIRSRNQYLQATNYPRCCGNEGFRSRIQRPSTDMHAPRALQLRLPILSRVSSTVTSVVIPVTLYNVGVTFYNGRIEREVEGDSRYRQIVELIESVRERKRRKERVHYLNCGKEVEMIKYVCNLFLRSSSILPLFFLLDDSIIRRTNR